MLHRCRICNKFGWKLEIAIDDTMYQYNKHYHVKCYRSALGEPEKWPTRAIDIAIVIGDLRRVERVKKERDEKHRKDSITKAKNHKPADWVGHHRGK